mmetsp:Transcript_38291/g.124524  ORF Transcript_38291/g.124524 Transcript_38291/m.124524 type:complete len:152 (+) Transcript_38291:2-457(+)
MHSGMDPGQCERNPRCTRGYKHGGLGGHCRLPGQAPPKANRRHRRRDTAPRSVVFAATSDGVVEPRAPSAPRAPPAARAHWKAGGARRDSSGRGKPLPKSLVPEPDLLWDAERRQRRLSPNSKQVTFAPLPSPGQSLAPRCQTRVFQPALR